MILNDFIQPKLKFSREKLDAVLVELCDMVIEGQQDNPDFYGMVAAAVLDTRGRLVTGVNYLYGNSRIHAERAAIDKYEEEYGELPKGSIVITTLSPCCEDTGDNRYGVSCTDLLNEKHIKLAYCGYSDPSQDNTQEKFTIIITENSKIKLLCKKLADTFLKKNLNEAVESNKAQEFIDRVYSQYPDWPYGQADKVMVWGEGEDQQFAAFKLKPSMKPDTVEIDWIMAGPEQRKGVGSRAIKELQRQAQEAGIKLTLYPWAKGNVSQASLTKLYKRHGFKPVAKGAKPMSWEPVSEESNKEILSYVKKIHPKDEFTIDHAVMNHAKWELTTVPLTSLHIDSDEVSPYDQINLVDYNYVKDITAQDIKNKPIVVDNEGWIIDGNHRAVAARDMGMTSMPAYVPLESDDDEETYDQHMARVNKERELSEVIYHNNIKTKNQDKSGLVNKGEPVPPGKEKRLLGNLVGNLGQLEVYKWDKGNDSAYSVFDPKTRVSQMTISGTNKPHSFEIFGIYGGPKAPIRAADLYAWLVKNQGLTLVSDKYQSPGGQRVWQDLEQRYGRSLNVYAFNMKTNKPINTGADDPESTHGYRGDIAQNVRLVAAPK